MPSADEKDSLSVSTAMMSFQRVIDQYGPNSLSGVKCTGSSRRSRAKYGQMVSA